MSFSRAGREAMSDERPPASPCIGICLVDPATRQCRGCLRTIDEIAAWYQASLAEKRAMVVALAARRAVAAGRAGHG
jgi:predicted Fe-S protein YdhL (DUF1289 family)